jgi:carboxyl-terminal processing protease
MIDGAGIAPDVEVFASAGMTESEAAKVTAALAPMTEPTKYYAGQQGLNVYAAQQRLALLGYEVEATSVMDEATVEAVKVFQQRAGGYPYGGLDYFTMNALNVAVRDFLSPAGEDAQLAAAVRLFE